MDSFQISDMQESARSIARAAGYLGKAAQELAPVALPAAREAVSRVPGAACGLARRTRALVPSDPSKRQIALAAVLGAGAIAFGAAAIAHVVHHRKVVSTYRAQRQAAALERQQRADVERELSGAAHTAAPSEVAGESWPAEGAAAPGCYVICVYDSEPDEGGRADFSEVYVGASKDMAASVEGQFDGRGNPYLAVDARYGRPMLAFFFPCEAHELYARREGLVRALGADGSYNRFVEIADLD